MSANFPRTYSFDFLNNAYTEYDVVFSVIGRKKRRLFQQSEQSRNMSLGSAIIMGQNLGKRGMTTVKMLVHATSPI